MISFLQVDKIKLRTPDRDIAIRLHKFLEMLTSALKIIKSGNSYSNWDDFQKWK